MFTITLFINNMSKCLKIIFKLLKIFKFNFDEEINIKVIIIVI